MCFVFLLLSGLLSISSCDKEENRADKNRTFRMTVSSEPPTLDWSLATDSISIRIIENIMEGLTQFDQDLNPVPMVAKGGKESGEGKTYTSTLRDSVKWSEGRGGRAQDFENA